MRPLEKALARALPPAHRQWQAWVRQEPALCRVTYEQLRADLVPGLSSRPHADVLLAALWRLAHRDREAGRVLLACLLPGVRAIATRYQHRLGYEEAFTVAVAGLWERIAHFDPPASHVAYRVLWLAGRRVHRAARDRREDVARSRPLTRDETVVEVSQEVSIGVTLGEAVSAGIVTRRDAWLVWATHCAGLTVAEAAMLLGLGYEQAKKRRQRADAALKAWLGASGNASA